MTIQLPLSEVIETAKRKLSSASACLNDSAAFSASVNEFDEWLTEHKDLISAHVPEETNVRLEIEQLIHQLTRLELQAQYNISLVTECRAIFMESSNSLPPLIPSYHR